MQKSTPRGCTFDHSLALLHRQFLGNQELLRVLGIVFEDVCTQCDLPLRLAEQLPHLQCDRFGEFIDLFSQDRRRLLENGLARRKWFQTPIRCVCLLRLSDDRLDIRIGV